MSELDRAKDSIGNTRMYMGICITFIIAIGASVLGSYNTGNTNAAFWAGLVSICGFVIVFAILARALHRKTDSLKDIK